VTQIVSRGLIAPFCQLLGVDDLQIVLVVLRGLTAVLVKVPEQRQSVCKTIKE
jgi:hypothetical protein